MAEKVGKFHVLGTLGRGAHSTILHIRRSLDSRQYALKIVPIGGRDDLKFLEQAEHEFRVARKLDHPNLIKIYLLEKVRSWLGGVREVRLLIEYVNGRTLDTFRVIPLPQLVQVFVCVASGLAHMHRRNVYHGDLKPSNIMLSRTGDVKIIDYGLAWIKGEPKDRVQGTPQYMAPEQFRDRIVNERTDIFNLGATMYRMVTFRNTPPLIASGTGAVSSGSQKLDSHAWDQNLKPVTAYNPKVPRRLADLIHRCLAYNPQQRPERVSEVQGILDHLVDDLVKSPDDELHALEWQE